MVTVLRLLPRLGRSPSGMPLAFRLGPVKAKAMPHTLLPNQTSRQSLSGKYPYRKAGGIPQGERPSRIIARHLFFWLRPGSAVSS